MEKVQNGSIDENFKVEISKSATSSIEVISCLLNLEIRIPTASILGPRAYIFRKMI